MRQIAAQIEGRKTEYDITRSAPGAEVTMGDGDLLVVGMPVYSGRIPASALPALRKFRGNGTPAVVVCVYGNRDYDDALLELRKTYTANRRIRSAVPSENRFCGRFRLFAGSRASGRPSL